MKSMPTKRKIYVFHICESKRKYKHTRALIVCGSNVGLRLRSRSINNIILYIFPWMIVLSENSLVDIVLSEFFRPPVDCFWLWMERKRWGLSILEWFTANGNRYEWLLEVSSVGFEKWSIVSSIPIHSDAFAGGRDLSCFSGKGTI